MDMRSLNTSLPRTSPSKQQVGEPPEQLLAAFKAAALSVTNLYKSAAAKQGKERAEGYQDALDELLTFLDKEDIGLSDGEGWRIRRWATERLDGRDSVAQNTESEDETEKTERGSSPVLQRSQSTTRISPTPLIRTASPTRTQSPAPQPAPSGVVSPSNEEPTVSLVPPHSTFTFRSSHQYPQDADVILSDLDLSENQRATSHDAQASNTTSAGITISRPPRNRHNNHNVRIKGRNTGTIGQGAGQKRKHINFGEFFDIGNLGHSKEGHGGGGKRGRFA